MRCTAQAKARRGGGRAEFALSGQRKKIMSRRAKRQAEDAANAARLAEEGRKAKTEEEEGK